MERVAVIELGSFTFRCLVVEVQGEDFLVLFRDRAYVNLAAGLKEGRGELPLAYFRGAISAILKFKARAQDLGCKEIFAIATGVIRSMGGAKKFLDEIKKATNIKPIIITGEKEAQLSLKGALWGLGRRQGSFCVFDIGGGSTELGFWLQGSTYFFTIPLGAVTLTDSYLGDLPSGSDIELARQRVLQELSHFKAPHHQELIGTGGTMISLAALKKGIMIGDITPESINGTRLFGAEIKEYAIKLSNMSLQERAVLPGLNPHRARPILGGIAILGSILEYLGHDQVIVSFFDLMEGAIITYLQGEGHEFR